MYSSRIKSAIDVAKLGHQHQFRKYTLTPYTDHLVEVAQLVFLFGGNENQIIAALLHDVIEDTKVTYKELESYFPLEVIDYVYWLTDVSVIFIGNRHTRKEMDRNHIAKAPEEAKFVKLADLISNMLSITQHDKNFAIVFLKETELLLTKLTPNEKSSKNYFNLYNFTSDIFIECKLKLMENDNE